MSDHIQQLQVPEKGGVFNVVSVPYPKPNSDEICIRTKAVGLNPLDWKSRSFGVMVQFWPAVFGVDVAGIVESVGDNVQGFKTGDEVFALCGLSNRAGAFQEVVAVPSFQAAKKPNHLSFEEAASLPITFVTAAAAVQVGLGVALPFIASGEGKKPKSILVLGGSSAVGANAIQLLRIALPNAKILTTSSSAHHARLTALGATQAFARSAQDDPSSIKAASPSGSGVDAILDAVTAAAGQPAVLSALDPNGLKLYTYVVTGQTPKVPEGIRSSEVFGRALFKVQGGMHAVQAVGHLIESGKYQVPVKVEVVGKGLKAIGDGLDKLQKGVSGTKYVVSI